MTEERHEMERLVVDAGWVEVPDDLRDHVLMAAGAFVRPDTSCLDRIWFSRAWRVAAVVALIVLAGLDALSGSQAPPGGARDGVAGETARAVEMSAREAGLTPAQAAAFGARAFAAASQTGLRVDALLERGIR